MANAQATKNAPPKTEPKAREEAQAPRIPMARTTFAMPNTQHVQGVLVNKGEVFATLEHPAAIGQQHVIAALRQTPHLIMRTEALA